MSEEELDAFDERVPELFREAVAKAYAGALASGYPVTVGLEGNIVQIRPDGTRKILKKLPPKIPVDRSKRLEIR